ncbi:NAD(P)-dependent oxidoreductase [Vibrio cholerae]
MKKVLVLGSTSFTGHSILSNIRNNFECYECSRNKETAHLEFDVFHDHINKIENFIKVNNIEYVINCISNGNVDSCETDPEVASKINYEFVKELCDIQKNVKFHLIHLSSNAVYDGEHAPYSERSEPNPINMYGRIKAKADKYLKDNSPLFTLLRPITMYGENYKGQRHNPFSYFYEQLMLEKDIVAVNDVYVNMLNVNDLVFVVGKVINDDVVGEFNISGDDVLNRYEFVMLIKKYIPSSKSKIISTNSNSFVTPAKRPKNTSFDNSLMKNTFNFVPESIDKAIAMLTSKINK